jgi:hypothetical protein
LPIAEVKPDRNYPVGRRRLGKRVWLMDGFVLHGKYWARGEPRHLEGLVASWLPVTSPPELRAQPRESEPAALEEAAARPVGELA